MARQPTVVGAMQGVTRAATGNPAYQGWAYSPFSACLWSAQRLLTYVYMSGNDPTGPRNCPDSQTPRTLDSCFVPAAGASSAAWLSVDTRCETNLMDTAVRVVPDATDPVSLLRGVMRHRAWLIG